MDSIQIPVRLHVLKYLQSHLGAHYFLSESDHFGLLLFQLLRRPLKDARRDDILTRYTGQFTVNFGSYDPDKYGLGKLTGKTCYQFNNFVHELVRAELHAWVDMATDHGNPVTFAIEQFMKRYKFEESDIAFDTLLKSWQRFAADRKLKKQRAPHLTPTKQLKQLEKTLLRIPVPTPAGMSSAASMAL
ncbi:MAG: hypothetical protein JWP58_1080 [Hymenobacter sp.]|nr:hypothetical protein [Hymenobacter sp.]